MNKRKKILLFDIDNTLVFGSEAQRFYAQYSQKLEENLALLAGITLGEANKLANKYRSQNDGRGELVFEDLQLDSDYWYQTLLSMDPANFLLPLPRVNQLLKQYQEEGWQLGAITDGPTPLAERILFQTKINKKIFRFFRGWNRGQRRPKDGRTDVFFEAADFFQSQPNEITMVGDSQSCDIAPARLAGLKTILISERKKPNLIELTLPNVLSLPLLIPLKTKG